MTLIQKAISWAFVATVAVLHCIVPHETVLSDSVDVLEVNHFYDCEGRLVFDQAIWLDSDEQVIAWRLIKSPSQLPVRDWESGGFVCRWIDGEKVREVRTNWIRETWSQHDPELLAREVLPKEKRRGLKSELGKPQ